MSNILAPDGSTLLSIQNYSEYQAMGIGISTLNTILDFPDKEVDSVSILAPPAMPPNIDYSASSFGVSSQCRVVHNSSCVLTHRNSPGIRVTDPDMDFRCSDPSMQLNVSGTIYDSQDQIHQYDFHQYIKEHTPFNNEAYEADIQEDMDRAGNLTDSEAGAMFSNPWKALAVFNVFDETLPRFGDLNSDDRFMWGKSAFVMFYCTNTGTLNGFTPSSQTNLYSVASQLHGC